MEFTKNENNVITFSDTSGINFEMWTKILRRFNHLGYDMPDEASVKAYLDRHVPLQPDQSAEILDLFGEMHKSARYTDAQISRDNRIAKEYFGTTRNFRHAGYILTDGTMLNFSGAGYIRDMDHREIAYPLNISTDDNASAGLIQFVAYGNIRLMNENFEVCKPPTTAQRRVLADIFRNRPTDVYVDIANSSGHVVKHFEYGVASIGQILHDIDDYFNTLA